MKRAQRIVTWLELAVAPHWHHSESVFRLHPVGKRSNEDEQYYAVSLNGRWLCSSNGRLTVLRGLATAEYFMRLINMPAYETGEPAEFEIEHGNAHCLAVSGERGLGTCETLSSGMH